MREPDPAALFAARFAWGQRLTEAQARRQAHQGAVFASELALMRFAEQQAGDTLPALAEARQHARDAHAAMAKAQAEIDAIEDEIAAIDRSIAATRAGFQQG